MQEDSQYYGRPTCCYTP